MTRFLLISLCIAAFPVALGEEKSTSMETLSVTKKDLPMVGPVALQQIDFEDVAKKSSDVIWITGYDLDLKHNAEQGSDFLCHSILRLSDKGADRPLDFSGTLGQDPSTQSHRLGFKKIYLQSQLFFTLSPGLMSARFPDRFGIPIRANEKVTAETMVQMPHHKTKIDKAGINSQAKVIFATEAKRGEMRPLARHSLYLTISSARADGHCAENATWSKVSMRQDPKNPDKNMVYHWMVPPGQHTYRSELQRFPFNTTIHAVLPHLHAFAKSIELTDETTQTSVFKIEARTDAKGSVEKLGSLSSQSGIPVFSDHVYRVTAIYHNTTSSEIDAMAVMHTYILDPTFEP